MGHNTTMTPEAYARLAAAFKEHPGEFSVAARLAGVPKHVAYKGWHHGWTKQSLPRLAPPEALPEVLVQQARIEQAKAETEADVARRLVEDAASRAALEATAADRAREARSQVAARADNRDEAVVVLDEERKLRKGLRSVTGQNLVASAKWGKAHQQVADLLLSRIERDGANMTAQELADLARSMAFVDRSRAALLRESSELERLHRGDPAVIVGITPTEMTTDEAVKEIERANQALQRYRRRGLELINGARQGEDGEIIDVTPAS